MKYYLYRDDIGLFLSTGTAHKAASETTTVCEYASKSTALASGLAAAQLLQVRFDDLTREGEEQVWPPQQS